jgi:hypothetical protein
MMMEERGFEVHRSSPSGVPQQTRSRSRRNQAPHTSMLGLKSAKTAYTTLKGIEVMRLIRKLQCILLRPGVAAEARFFNKLFRVYA